jgi:hypothetical protein
MFGFNCVNIGTVLGRKDAIVIYSNIISTNHSTVLNKNAASVIINQYLLDYDIWGVTYAQHHAGLQIGWNNVKDSGGTDFLTNMQGGGEGPCFNFWWMNSINKIPTHCASIRTDGAYYTVCDYRDCNNVITLDNTNTWTVDNLRPVQFNFMTNSNPSMGFIAHEVAAVFPNLVIGVKDGLRRQTMNYTGIIPILVAEIQRIKKYVNKSIILDDKAIFIRQSHDLNNQIVYEGNWLNGISIFGEQGVKIGTSMGRKDALIINSDMVYTQLDTVLSTHGPAFISRQKLLDFDLWGVKYNPQNSGLQVGWDNIHPTGGTDFLTNMQAGGGQNAYIDGICFHFWWMNNLNKTPFRCAVIRCNGNYETLSDYRVKNNVITMDETWTVDKLRPVIYHFKASDTPSMGFIAHEVQEVFPMLVSGEKDGKDHQTMNYTGIIPILVAEIQRLKSQLTKQQLQIDELFARMNTRN